MMKPRVEQMAKAKMLNDTPVAPAPLPPRPLRPVVWLPAAEVLPLDEDASPPVTVAIVLRVVLGVLDRVPAWTFVVNPILLVTLRETVALVTAALVVPVIKVVPPKALEIKLDVPPPLDRSLQAGDPVLSR